MENFDLLRDQMVADQLVARGINDPRVLDAFRKVPRHEFIPDDLKDSAYDDGPLPIGEDQTISQPYMVASMTELLRLRGGEKVLEIGTGSGYQAAILAELCRKVYTIDRIKILSDKAGKTLQRFGYQNIELVIGDGTEGYLPGAPYDGIVVTAGCPQIPPPLIEQLAEGGRLVLPVGDRFYQTLMIITKNEGKIRSESSFGCVFVPLVGKYGWQA